MNYAPDPRRSPMPRESNENKSINFFVLFFFLSFFSFWGAFPHSQSMRSTPSGPSINPITEIDCAFQREHQIGSRGNGNSENREKKKRRHRQENQKRKKMARVDPVLSQIFCVFLLPFPSFLFCFVFVTFFFASTGRVSKFLGPASLFSSGSRFGGGGGVGGGTIRRR